MRNSRRIQVIALPLFLCLFTYNLFGQCSYIGNISGGDNIEIVISIKPTSIIVNSPNCQNGYNFKFEFDYEITAFQNGAQLNNYSFYTLQGNIITNSGTIFFNLPNSTGSGTTQTSNAWNGNKVSDCSSITLSDIPIKNIEIQIENKDITNRTETIIYCTSPLPVELLYFTSSQKNRRVHLNWVTASEHDNDYFNLEKSYDGENWSLLGKIDGNGNSSSKTYYSYTDSLPQLGINYYRLSQFDFNGESKYLETISYNFSEKETQIRIFPNPTNQYLIVSGINENEKIALFTVEGKEINGLNIQYLNPSTVIFDTEPLSNGTYIVKTGNIVKKILKIQQ